MWYNVYQLTGIGFVSSLKCLSSLSTAHLSPTGTVSIATAVALGKSLRTCGWMFGSGDRGEEDLLQVVFIRITVTRMCTEPMTSMQG